VSGGRWDYQQYRLRDVTESVATDVEVARRFPRLAATLRQVGETVKDVMHDLDYDLSGDSEIRDDKAFEQQAIDKIQAAAQPK
jgi:Flp pilus assembly protein CpaB